MRDLRIYCITAVFYHLPPYVGSLLKNCANNRISMDRDYIPQVGITELLSVQISFNHSSCTKSAAILFESLISAFPLMYKLVQQVLTWESSFKTRDTG